MGVVARIDETVVAIYCETFSQWRAAESICREAAQRNPKNRGLLLETKSKNIIPHPARGVANKLRLDLVRLMTEIGLTPSARARLEAIPTTPTTSSPRNISTEGRACHATAHQCDRDLRRSGSRDDRDHPSPAAHRHRHAQRARPGRRDHRAQLLEPDRSSACRARGISSLAPSLVTAADSERYLPDALIEARNFGEAIEALIEHAPTVEELLATFVGQTMIPNPSSPIDRFAAPMTAAVPLSVQIHTGPYRAGVLRVEALQACRSHGRRENRRTVLHETVFLPPANVEFDAGEFDRRVSVVLSLRTFLALHDQLVAPIAEARVLEFPAMAGRH